MVRGIGMRKRVGEREMVRGDDDDEMRGGYGDEVGMRWYTQEERKKGRGKTRQ